MLTLSEAIQYVKIKIQPDRKQMATQFNKLIRAIVQEKDKTAISKKNNSSRKVAYNMLRDKLFKQVCVEFSVDADKFKKVVKKCFHHAKQKIYASVGNILAASKQMYDYAIQVLEVMLHDQREITAASKKSR